STALPVQSSVYPFSSTRRAESPPHCGLVLTVRHVSAPSSVCALCRISKHRKAGRIHPPSKNRRLTPVRRLHGPCDMSLLEGVTGSVKQRKHTRALLFRGALAIGFLLGALLLVETVAT